MFQNLRNIGAFESVSSTFASRKKTVLNPTISWTRKKSPTKGLLERGLFCWVLDFLRKEIEGTPKYKVSGSVKLALYAGINLIKD
jgi:hypothetical protein